VCLGAGLINQPVGVLIGQPGGDYACVRFPPAGDQLVRLNRDRDTIIRIEAAAQTARQGVIGPHRVTP